MRAARSTLGLTADPSGSGLTRSCRRRMPPSRSLLNAWSTCAPRKLGPAKPEFGVKFWFSGGESVLFGEGVEGSLVGGGCGLESVSAVWGRFGGPGRWVAVGRGRG